MPLNTQQQLAVNKTKGPCLIFAGPGTGKTFTLVEKIKHLIGSGEYKPNEILALTFSIEAANSLKRQVAKEIGNAEQITIRTFHSFCSDILRKEGRRIGIDPGFSILEPDDTKVFLYKDLDVSAYNSDLYSSTISTAKDLSISLEDIEKYTENLKQKLKIYCDDLNKLDEYAESQDIELNTLHLKPQDTVELRKQIREEKKAIVAFLDEYYVFRKYQDLVDAWKAYNDLKKERNLMDFSDLNLFALKYLNKFGNKAITDVYKYVLVDEFQDTNKAQFELIRHLAIDHKNITIVGDRNQSIYGFRGAYTENVAHFKEDFEVTKNDIIELNESHRSPNTVLRTSHKLILNNYTDKSECFLITNAKGIEGDKVKIFEMLNEDSEAWQIAELVQQKLEEGVPFHEICVLYRTHKQGAAIRRAFESKAIPIITAGSTDMLSRPEIKTVISYLGILNNLITRTGTGEQAWWNLFHYKNDLSPEDSVKIGRFLGSMRGEDDSIDNHLLNNLTKIGLSMHGKEIVLRVVNKLRELTKSTNKSLPELILDIYELVGLNRMFSHDRKIENVEALLNLKEFHSLAKYFSELHGQDLKGFIEYLEVLEEVGVEKSAEKIIPVDAVRLMTIHSVKGLQFDTVILSNLAEDRFPITRTPREPLIPKELIPYIKKHLASLGEIDEETKEEEIKKIEEEMMLLEERRLCYVGFTRSKRNLFLTYAKDYGGKREEEKGMSTFLTEIIGEGNQDLELLKIEEEKGTVIAPDSKYERVKTSLKKQLFESLDSEDFSSLLKRLIAYHSLKEAEIKDYKELIEKNWGKILDKKELEDNLNIAKQEISGIKFDNKEIRFSVSTLETYDDCPKKYELQHILHMPERGAFEEGSAMNYGSFIHKVFEEGVRQKLDSKEKYVELAGKIVDDPEFAGIKVEDVLPMIEVFWQRNSHKITDKTEVERYFRMEIEGLIFSGKVDRIDDLGNNDVEIVDYKSNTRDIEPRKRAWQLSIYAVASKKLGKNPKKLTLDMLKLEKPYEYEVDANGDAKCGRMKGFNVNDSMKEMVETAKKIIYDYEHEFKVTEDDNNCRFCGYKFYCPKWEA